LNNHDYETDDSYLSINCIPKSLTFETLYYYKLDNFKDKSKCLGFINLFECHEITIEDNENKFYLTIDIGDRKFEFQSEIKGERDSWFECLINCRKTVKDISRSIYKNPRNMCRLNNVINTKGLNGIKTFCEEEIEKIMDDIVV